MAVKKIKWSTLMSNLSICSALADLTAVIDEIDDLLNENISSSEDYLRALFDNVEGVFHPQTSIWKDMPIFISSYKEHDARFANLLCNKVREYINFYYKILTDSGVQRALAYSKSYSNSGSSSSQERGTDSVTPQNASLYDSQHPESDSLFDQAIADFASSINKTKGSTTSSTSGSSSTNVSGTTWEEAKQNLKLMFFNELKDYLMSLPERVYAYYSLETMPIRFLHEEFINYIKGLESIE